MQEFEPLKKLDDIVKWLRIEKEDALHWLSAEHMSDRRHFQDSDSGHGVVVGLFMQQKEEKKKRTTSQAKNRAKTDSSEAPTLRILVSRRGNTRDIKRLGFQT
ncbi:unnamed protein product [Caretta caretta]